MNDEIKQEIQQTPDETKPVELSDAALESVAGGGTKQKPDYPSETVHLDHTKIEWTY